MKLSKRVLKRAENLSKSFEFDMENHIATIPLHYETPEEMLDMHISSPSKPIVSDDIIDYLGELMTSVPGEFSVGFELTVDDYGEYSHESLLDALKVTIENTFYYHDENRKKDNILGVAFIIIGILLLAMETIGGADGWYGAGDSLSAMFIETILDVMVWVLTWEGAALIFMTYANESTSFSQAMKRFHGLVFLDKSGKKLGGLDKEQLYQGWIYLSGKEVFARNYILFSNAAIYAILSIFTVKLIADIEVISAIHVIGFAISWVLITTLVLSNISFYKEGHRLGNFALPFSFVCLALTIIYLIYSFATGNLIQTNNIWDLILIIVLIVNIVCLNYMRKQNVEVACVK